MMRSFRSVSLALTLAVALAAATPSGARAEGDDTLNTQITIGTLLLVVGILVWVGWEMDKEDDLRKAQSRSILPLLADAEDARAVGLYLDDLSDHGEDELDLSAGLAFRADF